MWRKWKYSERKLNDTDCLRGLAEAVMAKAEADSVYG